MKKRTMISLVLVIVVAASLTVSPWDKSAWAAGEAAGRYAEMLESPAHTQTIRSLALLMMSLPIERETVAPQIQQYAWFTFADAGLSESVKAVEQARLDKQLDDIEEVVADYGIREFVLTGFTEVGTVKNVDLYFAAETSNGPVVVRVSVYFKDEGPRLFGFEVFEGWEESRAATAGILHRPGQAVVSVTLGEEE